MLWFWMAITLVHKLALGLGLGASTFLLVSYMDADGDATAGAPERWLKAAVQFTLRTALAVVIAAQFILLSSFPPADLSGLTGDPTFVVNWLMIAAILGSALLVRVDRVPAWAGPVVAGGSWYALFLLHAWPGPVPLNTAELFGVYIGFLLLFAGAFMALKRRLGTKPFPVIS